MHPLYLKRAGKSRTNHAQMTPYPSKDIMLNNEEYNNLCNAFDEFFEFMEQQVGFQSSYALRCALIPSS